MKLPQAKAQKLIDGKYDGKTVVMGIRPEHISDEASDLANSNAKISVEVTGYELLGAESMIYFSYAGNDMSAKVSPNSTARYGDKIEVALDMDMVHVFDKESELTITN